MRISKHSCVHRSEGRNWRVKKNQFNLYVLHQVWSPCLLELGIACYMWLLPEHQFYFSSFSVLVVVMMMMIHMLLFNGICVVK